MKKIEFCAADYDYTKTYPDIDYSERITESGLVLPMRQIYERYAAQGINLLNGDLVEDDDDPDRTVTNEFDDPLDMLQASMAIKAREIPSRKKSKPDGPNQPDGKQRKDDTMVSPTDAPEPPAPAGGSVSKTGRQNGAKRSDGAQDD